jgi:hypothetical protein
MIRLGTTIGLDLAFKKRALLLQTIFLHANQTHQEGTLIDALCRLFDHKQKLLHDLLKTYPHTAELLHTQHLRIEAAKLRLQHEYALATKENDGNA